MNLDETFTVQPAKLDGRYCPYCNRFPILDMTDEHVYPQSIGGDSRTVIRVCSDCNSRAGQKVDASISRFTSLRIVAVFARKFMHRQERHESVGVLKDGPKNKATINFDLT